MMGKVAAYEVLCQALQNEGCSTIFFPIGGPMSEAIATVGRELGFPDYEKIAHAFGGYGERVERPQEIRPALERAKASGTSAILNVITDPKAAATTARFTEYEYAEALIRPLGGSHQLIRCSWERGQTSNHRRLVETSDEKRSTSLAARMEGLAKGDSIVVSEPPHRLTEGYFLFKELGAAKVKRVSEPVPIYELLGVGPLRTRLQVAAWRGLVKFTVAGAGQERRGPAAAAGDLRLVHRGV